MNNPLPQRQSKAAYSQLKVGACSKPNLAKYRGNLT